MPLMTHSFYFISLSFTYEKTNIEKVLFIDKKIVKFFFFKPLEKCRSWHILSISFLYLLHMRKQICKRNLKFELLSKNKKNPLNYLWEKFREFLGEKICQSIFDWKTIFTVISTVSFKNRVKDCFGSKLCGNQNYWTFFGLLRTS